MPTIEEARASLQIDLAFEGVGKRTRVVVDGDRLKVFWRGGLPEWREGEWQGYAFKSVAEKENWTVCLNEHYNSGGYVYIDVRPYSLGPNDKHFCAELEQRSGNARNDGLQANTTLTRLNREQLTALRDAMTAILGED